MKRTFAALTLTAALAVGIGTQASAEPTIAATAACTGKNGKWVTVTVDVPTEAIVVGYWQGRDARQTGNRFVPDAGGSNAAGDYELDIRLEVWDKPDTANHKVLATGMVHTPTCTAPKLLTAVPK